MKNLKTTILLFAFLPIFFSCNNDEDELRIQAEQFLIGEWQVNSVSLTATLPDGSESICHTGPHSLNQPDGTMTLTDGKFGSFSNASTCMGNTGLNSEVWTFEWIVDVKKSFLRLDSDQKGNLDWKINSLSQNELIVSWESDVTTQGGRLIHNEYELIFKK